MIKSIKNQSKLLLNKPTVVCVFLFLCAVVLFNYIRNVTMYQGSDVIEMYHPMHILTMNDYEYDGFIILQLLPLLIVLPCGFSYFEDKVSGMEIFQVARYGRKYYWAKIVAVFGVSMFVFTVPFLLEMVMNMLSFPLEAKSDMSGFSFYDEPIINIVKEYLFYELYLYDVYLYTFICILLFGIWMGVLASFVVAISYFPFVKFRLILFLPLYILIELLDFLCSSGVIKENTYYCDYFYLFHSSSKSEKGYFLLLGGIFLVTIAITLWKCRRDCRN